MFARGIGGMMSGRRLIQGAGAFNGNFASLFTPGTVLQSVQTDLGLTYGGTMLPNAGNTSTSVITLTGSLSGVPVPIWLKPTVGGAVGGATATNVYLDGAGVSISQTILTPAVNTPVALTGAATGLFATFSAGNLVNNDIWKATCSALADQGPAALNYSQAGPSLQPLMSAGVNGYAGLLFDGVNDVLASALALPAPGTTPTWYGATFRNVTWVSNSFIFGDSVGSGHILFSSPATPNLRPFNGASGPIQNVTLGTWEATELGFQNSAADYIRRGSNAATTGIAGNAASTGRGIGGSPAPGNWANIEFLSIIYLNVIPTPAQIGAWRAAVTAKYGATVNV